MKIRKDFLPYSKPYITGMEHIYINKAINSGWWSKGEMTLEFENKIAKYTDVKYALALSSCTAALHIGCIAAGITPGDEVITTAMTFCSTINVITQCGGKPVFCDIDPKTGLMDVGLIEGLITQKTKAILPVHYAGSCCDMDSIMNTANKHNLRVIEDCAHSLGSFFNGKHTGGFGDVGALSFYATKNLSCGEGGMLLTNNEDVYNKALLLQLHGMDKNAYKRYSNKGSYKYDIVTAGFKYNMNDILAGIGLAQLEEFSNMQKKRNQYKTIYNERLNNLKGIQLLKGSNNTVNSNHLYIIQAKDYDRDKLIEKLTAYNIGTSVHFIPIHHMSLYKNENIYLPNTDNYFNEIISLPLYPSMKEKDVNYVADALWEITKDF